MERMASGLREAIALLLTLVWGLSLCVGALGQSGTSSVQGTVLDPQKRVVTGATVSLTNAERKFLGAQKSSEDGRYINGRFNRLKVRRRVSKS